jgi:predicted transcriptional regulator
MSLFQLGQILTDNVDSLAETTEATKAKLIEKAVTKLKIMLKGCP